MRASVGRYPLRRDSEQLFIIAAARRLLDVGVYLVLPDASVAHGLDGAAQDGKRGVLGKKPDFDVRKFLIQVVQRLASLGSADRVSRLRTFRLVCLCQSFARNVAATLRQRAARRLCLPRCLLRRVFPIRFGAQIFNKPLRRSANEICRRPLSAFPPKANKCGATTDVCFGPIADILGLIRLAGRRAQGVAIDRGVLIMLTVIPAGARL
jgi:hypothetical protein